MTYDPRRALHQARRLRDQQALDRWNAAQERAKGAYDDCPDACAQEPEASCYACRDRNHSRCRGTASVGGIRVDCVCAREGHVL